MGAGPGGGVALMGTILKIFHYFRVGSTDFVAEPTVIMVIIMIIIGTINIIIIMLLFRQRGAWSQSGGYR